MPRLILIELGLLLTPFIAFGLHRYLVAEAEAEGRKPWPINLLFGVGIALAAAFWLFFIMTADRDRDSCFEPDRFDTETGELVKGRRVPCERSVGDVGIPRTEDPGGEATGVQRQPEPEAAPTP